MSRTRLARVAALGAALLFSGGSVHATPLFGFSSPSGGFDASQWTYGYAFTVVSGATVTVDGLGLWDVGGDGLAVTHQVELWTGSGTPVPGVSAILGPGAGVPTTGVDGFVYAAIDQVVLGAGDYVLGAAYRQSGENVDALVTVDLLATPSPIIENLPDDTEFVSGAIGFGTGPTAVFPTFFPTDVAYFGPTLRIPTASVAEPLTLALLMIGMAGLGLARRL